MKNVFFAQVKKSTTIPRRFSICEGRNIDVRRYYGNTQPLPVSIPVTELEPNSDRENICDKEDDMILIKQQSEHSLGSIVFNGSLLKTNAMAGCFMTVTPDNDGHLNAPDNLKVFKTCDRLGATKIFIVSFERAFKVIFKIMLQIFHISLTLEIF